MVVVDASASTRRHGALGKAKGLLDEMLAAARKRRVRLVVLEAAGSQTQWLGNGRLATAALQEWLSSLGAGGGTPLLDALQQAAAWQARRQRSHPAENHRLWVITDGRIRKWPQLAPSACPALLIDIESAPIRLGRARQLADALGAQYHHIDTLPALPAPQ